MKRKKLMFIPAVITLSLFLMACPKTKNVVPPVDDETQSSVQATYMNYLVSDIEMLASFMGESPDLDFFYQPVSGQLIPNNPTPNRIAISYNHTLCRDGRTRHGSLFLDYVVTPQYPNASYMRAYKFSGSISFSDYSVDDYKINLNVEDGGYFTIKNALTTETYSPKSTRLSWTIDGKLKFTHLTDAAKNMTWEGHWVKTLDNTSSNLVVVSPTVPINWYNAEISYKGTTIGTVPVSNKDGEVKTTSFSMRFNPEHPLTRNFHCTADPVLDVQNNGNSGMAAVRSEHHPFVKGIASFTVGEAYPREIYYGNEGQRETLPYSQCDNSGEVLIKGVSHKVDFLK